MVTQNELSIGIWIIIILFLIINYKIFLNKMKKNEKLIIDSIERSGNSINTEIKNLIDETKKRE